MTELEKMGTRAKIAAKNLRITSADTKTEALQAISAALRTKTDEILAANACDIADAESNGMSESMLDRLRLSRERIESMADAVAAVSKWPDPVGKLIEEYDRPNGLHIRKVSVPLGVIGIIFESRPNVTSDCAALCIRAGNAVVLRGGKEAFRSNMAITDAMRGVLAENGLYENCIQLVTDTTRNSATEMMNLTEYLDVLIPRGGAGLIHSVVDNARVPVIETGSGNCHIFVDKDADIDMAVDIVYNAKTSRPSVCNAAEKLLIHKDIADKALPAIGAKLRRGNVELRGDETARSIFSDMTNAVSKDWGCEYVDLIMGVKIVDSIDDAIDHIERWSTHHSDCIVTESRDAAEKFMAEIDSAAVYWNASTRFTDGGEMGLGAEIGISTQKLHARGPMGVNQLVTYKYELIGSGQIRL